MIRDYLRTGWLNTMVLVNDVDLHLLTGFCYTPSHCIAPQSEMIDGGFSRIAKLYAVILSKVDVHPAIDFSTHHRREIPGPR